MMTGAAASFAYAAADKSSVGAIRARIDELLGMGGLVDKADRLVGELSHGDQRATEIMMALALRPRLLLLDEPTAGMGDQETYDTTQLTSADRILVMAEGKVLSEGTPAEIAADEAVQVAYLGREAT